MDAHKDSTLTADDVAALLHDKSGKSRARVAHKVGVSFGLPELNANGRAVAEDIIRTFAHDATVEVRGALAESVKASPDLPRDVALELAQDVDAVALPVMQFSQSLTDADLIEIVRTGSQERQKAVASRPDLAPDVVESVIEHGGEGAVVALLNNRAVPIGEASFSRVLNRFGDAQSVSNAVACRESLPPAAADNPTNTVSGKLQSHLETTMIEHSTPKETPPKNRDLSRGALHAVNTSATDPFLKAREMAGKKRLTPQILLRAISVCDLAFFEAGLAVLASIPLSNARVLISDPGALGLKSLLRRANISPQLAPFFRVGLAIAKGLDGEEDAETYRVRRRDIALKTLALFEESYVGDVDELLGKLDEFGATPDSAPKVVHYGT